MSRIWRGSGTRPRPWALAVALALFAALVLCRSPYLTTTPRLWAEEGTVYLAAAWKYGAASLALPHIGYFSLLPNVAGWLASLLPLRWAPLAPTILGFAGMLTAATMVLTSRNPHLSGSWARYVAMLGLVFVPPASGEIWLNSNLVQVFLTVAAFFVLIEPRPNKIHVVLLAVLGLSAPSVAFLLPFV